MAEVMSRTGMNLARFRKKRRQQTGGLPEAIKEFETVRELDGENGNPETVAQLGHADALAGKHKEALELLERLQNFPETRYFSSYNLALIHIGLGQNEDAIAALQRAADERTD